MYQIKVTDLDLNCQGQIKVIISGIGLNIFVFSTVPSLYILCVWTCIRTWQSCCI